MLVILLDNGYIDSKLRYLCTKAVSLISESTRKTIEQVYGSFDEWLELKIEASVGKAKTDKNKKE